MKISDWTEGVPAGREAAARQRTAAILREATGAGDDTVVFGLAEYGAAEQPLVVTLWAATTAGFAAVRVTTNPDERFEDNRAGIKLSVESWQRIPVLRLDGVSPLSEPLAVTLTVGSTTISSTETNAQEVAMLYRACAGFLRGTASDRPGSDVAGEAPDEPFQLV